MSWLTKTEWYGASSERWAIQAGHRYACALTRNAAAAEELVATAWIEVAAALPPGPRGQAATRLALWKAIRTRFEASDGKSHASSGESLWPEWEALETAEAESVYLATVEGLTHHEVSVFTQQSIAGVRRCIATGRAKLALAFGGGNISRQGCAP